MEAAGYPCHAVGHRKPLRTPNLTPKARTMSSNDSSPGSLDADEPTGREAPAAGQGGSQDSAPAATLGDLA